jgi:hypothetical protein
MNTKPTLDEEEIFDGNNTLRSQYRFHTDEEDLESLRPLDESMNVENMDSEMVRSEY